jgi:predicted PurR-regulated permease PerM
MASNDVAHTARRTATVLGVVLVAAVLLLLAYATRRVLTWILIAAFFAVALDPVASWLERRLTWCRRWLATLLVFVVVFAVLTGLVALFVVPLVREGAQLSQQFPQLVDDVKAGRGPVGQLAARFHVVQYLQDHADQLRQYVSKLGAPTLAFLRGAATTVAGIVTILVLAYLMVLQAPKLVAGFLALFDHRGAERIRRVGGDCGRTVTGYISGNLLISVICALLTYVTLKLLGVPYAGLIAVFVGFADLIPLVGATLGAIVAAIAGFAHSTTAGIVVIVFFIVYQQVENHLLQPLIFARTVKLNPLTVLIAILLAAELAGILGALLAIPVAGMVQVIVRDVWDARRGRPKREPTVGEEEAEEAAPSDEDVPVGHRP